MLLARVNFSLDRPLPARLALLEEVLYHKAEICQDITARLDKSVSQSHLWTTGEEEIAFMYISI